MWVLGVCLGRSPSDVYLFRSLLECVAVSSVGSVLVCGLIHKLSELLLQVSLGVQHHNAGPFVCRFDFDGLIVTEETQGFLMVGR